MEVGQHLDATVCIAFMCGQKNFRVDPRSPPLPPPPLSPNGNEYHPSRATEAEVLESPEKFASFLAWVDEELEVRARLAV